MKLQIKSIILWPRNTAFAPRIILLAPGLVNVITGASKTGKSSVVPIIDYCLGADRCAIPVRTIRDACAWFGLLLQLDNGEMLVARREPGEQQSTGDAFVLEGDSIDIPHQIERKNTNIDAVKNRFDELAGLSNLDFETDSASGFKARPSFRDLMAFCFQPQNLIANPDVLFFKADTIEHKEKLKTIFPYILGAVDANLLAKRVELEYLIKQAKQKERELKSQQESSSAFVAQLQAWVSEANALGLISADTPLKTNQDELLRALGKIAQCTSRDLNLTVANVESAGREAAQLGKDEGEVALELGKLRRRLDGMQKLRSSVDEYTGALRKQRDRLEVSQWLKALPDKKHTCPICEGPLDNAHKELNELCDALAVVEASSRRTASVPVAFSREFQEVRVQLTASTEKLQAIRQRKRAIEQSSKQILDAGLRASSVDRFLGRLEQSLTSYRQHLRDDGLSNALEELKERIAELRIAIDSQRVKQRLARALKQITTHMAIVLPQLDCENPTDPVDIDIDDLTLKIASADGRKNYLWEIGSGANWLAYHVAVFIALHRYFMGLGHTPVPSLLVIDQPSQVYFPRKLAGQGRDEELPDLSDEDSQAVRKVFEQLGKFTDNSREQMQIIVLDHAGPDVWDDLIGVTLVEEWRDGKQKLVPDAWLQ